MSNYEQPIQDTERHYIEMIKEVESIDPNILISVVPDSRLHEFINTPISEITDKG